MARNRVSRTVLFGSVMETQVETTSFLLPSLSKSRLHLRSFWKVMKGNQKGVANERRRQSLRIIKPDSIAKKPEPVVHKSSKKTKKTKKSKKNGPVRAPSVESLSASIESEREGSDREFINSVLVRTIGEQIMLARIIDEEREYDRQGSPSDTWNYWLNVKQKNIWWKELYELDKAARGLLPKKKDKKRSGREDFGVHGRRICWTSLNGGDKARVSRLKDE
ncbi:hypothetical protein F2Q69_00034381 [Brassica cretica]|uniref:DUF287 domain-containing protein n=1 Tax=Brassica cretica TaxID=69181 RepID=A0A8S9SH79_BRACR|nr:hypothetical protein F2Q69_00034381 [Brassica cretica]